MTVDVRYREWLQSYPNEPHERMSMALQAIEAFEAIERSGSVTAADFDRLVRAFCSNDEMVFDTGCSLLVALAQTRPEAQQRLLDMAKHSSATARFHAIAYVVKSLPSALVNEIVGLALSDCSAAVRCKGIDQTEGLGLTEFLPKLDEMQRTEADDSVLQQLEFSIPLLRDGYFVSPTEDGAGYDLTIRTPYGLAGGPVIPKDQFSDEFVRREVARVKGGKDRLGQIIMRSLAKLRDWNKA